LLLITAMLAPDVGALISYGANHLENQPQYVDFMRPDALTLNDLKLATGSNSNDLVLDAGRGYQGG